MAIRLRNDPKDKMGIGLVHYVEDWLKKHRVKYDRIETYEYIGEAGKSDGVISHFDVTLPKEESPIPESTGAILKEAHITFRIG